MSDCNGDSSYYVGFFSYVCIELSDLLLVNLIEFRVDILSSIDNILLKEFLVNGLCVSLVSEDCVFI